MIVIRIELHSAVTRRVIEIARMTICNVGGTAAHGNYEGKTFVGRDATALNKGKVSRIGGVLSYPRARVHVWNLVRRMLEDMGYVQ